jgi:hypothetical protein
MDSSGSQMMRNCSQLYTKQESREETKFMGTTNRENMKLNFLYITFKLKTTGSGSKDIKIILLSSTTAMMVASASKGI